jgi:hypothetical protein
MKRRQLGQSMVEYAIAIGCVAALCMIALGSLGHISGHIITNVNNAINDPDGFLGDPVMITKQGAQPWILQ